MSQPDKSASDSGLKYHLTDVQALRSLTHPFSPFSAPTPQTRASFETKTSAINVSPSPQGRYDIKQIQDDSLWLSEETKIDETAALRIAVLEWQSRPALRLLRAELDDAVANVKNAIGGVSSQVSIAASQSACFTRSSLLGKDTTASFDRPDARRQRLLELYLSERRFVVKTCEHIVFVALCESTSQDAKGKSADRSGWIAKLGHDILSTWNIHGNVRDTSKNFFIDAIEAISTRIQVLESGSGWFKDEGSQEELEMNFARNQVLEIIHAMQIMLVLLESSRKISRSDVCLGWFRFMATCGFFESFQPVYF